MKEMSWWKKVLLIGFVNLLFLFPSMAMAAEVTILWNTQANVTGFKVEQSLDLGVTWDVVKDVVDPIATSTVIANVPETGLVLFRVVAYNDVSKAIRYEAGPWYNHLWVPIPPPAGVGIQ